MLQGHIDVAKVEFPTGVTGQRLDSLARHYLWQAGQDYNHGTGHGVGAMLNVHEAPPTIGFRPGGSSVAFEPGMIVSNEPGYYEAGDHGIRIECLQVCQPSPQHDNWLGFEVLTLVPIQRALVNVKLLSAPQLEWLNDFHQQVEDTIGPLVAQSGDKRALDWLREACKPL